EFVDLPGVAGDLDPDDVPRLVERLALRRAAGVRVAAVALEAVVVVAHGLAASVGQGTPPTVWGVGVPDARLFLGPDPEPPFNQEIALVEPVFGDVAQGLDLPDDVLVRIADEGLADLAAVRGEGAADDVVEGVVAQALAEGGRAARDSTRG